ncbi:MAG: GIY-YIG nuclease family protein [Rhodocyclaceae bacterium]|nr:GIY-YIG nuclease family protein [Rhodocyclaceae bacterium]MCA3033908.1 GIY-YIG nuclease family protein [Rhodocyclaceae bacterium]MCA3084460.1 GIY-YIG nuclease family protein [Rhodocyclaceae bacterium]
MPKQYYVYIVTNKPYGTHYTGVTRDLVRRTFEHKGDFVEGFSKAHRLKKLVWYEVHEDILAAITREKQIKEWRRDWKINLIQTMNPNWDDLYLDIV